jgi:hypothetical protein
MAQPVQTIAGGGLVAAGSGVLGLVLHIDWSVLRVVVCLSLLMVAIGTYRLIKGEIVLKLAKKRLRDRPD